MKYGVANLGKDLGIKPASVRVALRKAKVKSPYEWDSQTAYETVKKKLEAKARSKKKRPVKKKTPAKKKPAEQSAQLPA